MVIVFFLDDDVVVAFFLSLIAIRRNNATAPITPIFLYGTCVFKQKSF